MVSLPVTVHCKYPATFPPIVDSIVTSMVERANLKLIKILLYIKQTVLSVKIDMNRDN
jgi:hypothetical protein